MISINLFTHRSEDAMTEDVGSSLCSALGLPIIAGLSLMGLILMKLEE
jgi:hypothetical protein